MAADGAVEPYAPSKPARLPGSVTATAMTVFASLPLEAPEPTAWEWEFGFRWHGGWQPVLGAEPVPNEGIPSEKGRGVVWVLVIDGLEPNSNYVVRARARADDGLAGDWSERSSVIATAKGAAAPPDPAAEPTGAADDFFAVAGAFLKDGIADIKREIAGGAEGADGGGDEEGDEWAAPTVATPPPLMLAKADTVEFHPDESYASVEDEAEDDDLSVLRRFELGL